ncbi:MAG: DUF2461 domain-containing protein [Flavobacteriales bacterium]|nr:DUF2461 domain-containing protein [Flavobacteriales bacterium]
MLSLKYIDFFKELSTKNNKEWFDAHKQVYENEVKKPFYELTQQVIERLKTLDPHFDIMAKDAVFRINRDVRFSKDKSPYKLHMAASISTTHKKDWNNPNGIYFQISAEGVMIGGGLYMPDKEVVQALRWAIANESKQFNKIITSPTFKEKLGKIEGEKNKIISADLKNAAKNNSLIFNKQFYYWREYRGKKNIIRSDLADFIVEHYIASLDFIRFVQQAIHEYL